MKTVMYLSVLISHVKSYFHKMPEMKCAYIFQSSIPIHQSICNVFFCGGGGLLSLVWAQYVIMT